MKELDIGYLIKRLDIRLKARSDKVMSQDELTYAQVRVLQVIGGNGGEVTQKLIETELNVSHPTVVGIVTRLSKSGYVSCRIDPLDHRNKLVCVTERAIAHKAWHDAQIRQVEALLTTGFSEEELKQLREFLNRLYQNIE